MSSSTELCPCGSKKLFSQCCQPLLNGEKTAETPEQLMRSRFTAFSRADAWGYVLKTWHPDNRPAVSEAELAEESRLAKWEKLEIRETKVNGEQFPLKQSSEIPQLTNKNTNKKNTILYFIFFLKISVYSKFELIDKNFFKT